MSQSSNVTIAIIDDEKHILSSLKRLLRKTGWRVLAYEDPREAIDGLMHEPVDIFISDYRMAAMNGVTLLNSFKRSHPDALRMILSGQADISGVLNAINESEVYRFILKPWSDEDLLFTLRNALEYNRLVQENLRLAETVREQQRRIAMQEKELSRLEKESPGITQVERDEEGFINLYDDNHE